MTALTPRPDHNISPPAEGQATGVRLAVTRLTLTNFRSYPAGEIAASGKPVVLVGPNGAGKTNVLDALSLLQHGPDHAG